MLWLDRTGNLRNQLDQLAVVTTVVAGKGVGGGQDQPAVQSLCRYRCSGEDNGRAI
jgi:hypothetical protein